jgi:hypothetical protein
LTLHAFFELRSIDRRRLVATIRNEERALRTFGKLFPLAMGVEAGAP